MLAYVRTFLFRSKKSNKENKAPAMTSNTMTNEGPLNLTRQAGASSHLAQNTMWVQPAAETRTRFYQLMPPTPLQTTTAPIQLDLSQNRSDYSIQRLTSATEPFRLSFGQSAASSGPTIQLARPTQTRETTFPAQPWISLAQTSRPTITLLTPNNPGPSRAVASSAITRAPEAAITRPTVFVPRTDRRSSLPSMSASNSNSSTSSTSQPETQRRSNSPPPGCANATSTWKSRQPMECDFCNRIFSNKFNLKQVRIGFNHFNHI